jgi:hypothetical protein
MIYLFYKYFLNKKNNIEINGITSGEETIYVFGTKGYQAIPLPKPFLLMDESEKNAALYQIMDITRKSFKILD